MSRRIPVIVLIIFLIVIILVVVLYNICRRESNSDNSSPLPDTTVSEIVE